MQSLPASQDKAVVVEGTAWRLLDDQRATHISAPPQEWKHAAKQRFLPNTQILKKHKEKLEKQISDLHFTDHRFFFVVVFVLQAIWAVTTHQKNHATEQTSHNDEKMDISLLLKANIYSQG